MSHSKLLYGLVAIMGSVSAHAAYTFTPFNTWGDSDANMGIAGYTIEDFEDVNIVAGLQVSVTSANGSYGPTSTIPNTFNPTTDSTHGNAFQLGGGGAWDGTHGLINTRTNREFPYGESGSWGFTKFTFASAVTSVGFSVQQLDLSPAVYINGNLVGALDTLTGWSPNGLRQGFVRIDGTGGSTISSIEIRNGSNQSFGDGIMFDHVAFNAVPEPASMTAVGLGLFALMRRKRRAG